MYPMCTGYLSYIQKHHEPELNNHKSEKTLVLLFLKLFEPRNNSNYKEFLLTFSLRAPSMALPFLLPILSVMLNQISLSISSFQQSFEKIVCFIQGLFPAMFRLMQTVYQYKLRINSINADLQPNCLNRPFLYQNDLIFGKQTDTY